MFELKEEDFYDEEKGEMKVFKCCDIDDIIQQNECSIKPEDILKNEKDILLVKQSLLIVKQFLDVARRSGCWYDD